MLHRLQWIWYGTWDIIITKEVFVLLWMIYYISLVHLLGMQSFKMMKINLSNEYYQSNCREIESATNNASHIAYTTHLKHVAVLNKEMR